MEDDVGGNIIAIFDRRRSAAIALCNYYAGLILAEFRKRQPPDAPSTFIAKYNGVGTGDYWNNRTTAAARSVFADAIIDDEEIGFFIAHMLEYGVYLELANDRKHEALRPLIDEFFVPFKKDLEELYGAVA